MLSVPAIFQALGRSRNFNSALFQFLLGCLPVQALQVVLYPLQSMLIAQTMSVSIMIAAAVAAVVHLLTNYLLIHVLGWGLNGCALALCVSYAVMVGCLVA